MKINREWKDFEILATGDGEKLERWGDTVLLRPDPQVIWRADKPLTQIRRPDARYIRSQTGASVKKDRQSRKAPVLTQNRTKTHFH